MSRPLHAVMEAAVQHVTEVNLKGLVHPKMKIQSSSTQYADGTWAKFPSPQNAFGIREVNRERF